jgi:hypothetical protein
MPLMLTITEHAQGTNKCQEAGTAKRADWERREQPSGIL